jgi:hypothetical protein
MWGGVLSQGRISDLSDKSKMLWSNLLNLDLCSRFPKGSDPPGIRVDRYCGINIHWTWVVDRVRLFGLTCVWQSHCGLIMLVGRMIVYK